MGQGSPGDGGKVSEDTWELLAYDLLVSLQDETYGELSEVRAQVPPLSFNMAPEVRDERYRALAARLRALAEKKE